MSEADKRRVSKRSKKSKKSRLYKQKITHESRQLKDSTFCFLVLFFTIGSKKYKTPLGLNYFTNTRNKKIKDCIKLANTF